VATARRYHRWPFQNGFGGKLPGFQVNSGNKAYGDGFGERSELYPVKNSNPTTSFRDNVSKIFGKHSLQFGAYIAIGQKKRNGRFRTLETTGSHYQDQLKIQPQGMPLLTC